jgi:hypothetical protein
MRREDLRAAGRPGKVVAMNTLQEIKAAAAKLPVEERSELARGNVAPLDMAEIKRKVRARVEAGRKA